MYVCMYVCMQSHTHTHTHRYIYIYIYIVYNTHKYAFYVYVDLYRERTLLFTVVGSAALGPNLGRWVFLDRPTRTLSFPGWG